MAKPTSPKESEACPDDAHAFEEVIISGNLDGKRKNVPAWHCEKCGQLVERVDPRATC